MNYDEAIALSDEIRATEFMDVCDIHRNSFTGEWLVRVIYRERHPNGRVKNFCVKRWIAGREAWQQFKLDAPVIANRPPIRKARA